MQTFKWSKKKGFELLDQTLLPHEIKYVSVKDSETAAKTIEDMQVRGAPAIGVTAAFGVYLGAEEFDGSNIKKLREHLLKVIKRLAKTRPTAVNLFWALKKMENIVCSGRHVSRDEMKNELLSEALLIWKEDYESCVKIGDLGASLINKKIGILTHCNAGGLATAGYGTALGVIRSAYKAGKISIVYVDETRPWLQGARLTSFELVQDKIPATLICDNMAASLMEAGKIEAVVVGADRIAANGDVANKIGTYGVAVLANYHKIPFYVAAPISTIDTSIDNGKKIRIEQRGENEVRSICGKEICPKNVKVINPAFDVTPAKLVTAIITERGICRKPYSKCIREIAK